MASRENGALDLRFAQIAPGTLDPRKVEFTPNDRRLISAPNAQRLQRKTSI